MIVPSDLSGEAELYTEDASSHVTPVTQPYLTITAQSRQEISDVQLLEAQLIDARFS